MASRVPIWAQRSSFVLALSGVAVATYLTIERLTSPKVLACPNAGIINCQRVTDSASSKVFGVPVAFLGLLFFIGMAVLTHPRFWADQRPRVRQARVAGAAVGVVFVLYLIWAELFVVNAICLWCTVIHAVAIGLYGVIVIGITGDVPKGRRR